MIPLANIYIFIIINNQGLEKLENITLHIGFATETVNLREKNESYVSMGLMMLKLVAMFLLTKYFVDVKTY